MRLKLLGHLNALFAADGRPDDLDVVFEVEKLAQIFPRLRYVIYDQDPDFFFSILSHLLWFPQLSERAGYLSFKCKSLTSPSTSIRREVKNCNGPPIAAHSGVNGSFKEWPLLLPD